MNSRDILLGRGRFCYRNPGNVAFRRMIKDIVAKYSFHANRCVKREIIESLINQVREQGRFFLVRSLHDDKWCEAHPKLVRSKVSHALRDARNSANQQQALKKSSDTRQQTMLSMKPSITAFDWSDMCIKTLRDLKSEYFDEILDYLSLQSLDDYEAYKHTSESKTKIGLEGEIVKLPKSIPHLCFESDDIPPFDESSTEYNRNRDASCKILNNCSMHTGTECPRQFSTPSSRDMLIYALSLLDLSSIKTPLESKLATPDTTYSKNSDSESGKKLEQRSSLIKIWCEGPAKSSL